MTRRPEPRWHPDADKRKGDAVGVKKNSRWFHPKSGHLYVVLGVVFDAERERWMVHYERESLPEDADLVTYVHLTEDFLREGRFLPVKD